MMAVSRGSTPTCQYCGRAAITASPPIMLTIFFTSDFCCHEPIESLPPTSLVGQAEGWKPTWACRYRMDEGGSTPWTRLAVCTHVLLFKLFSSRTMCVHVFSVCCSWKRPCWFTRHCVEARHGCYSAYLNMVSESEELNAYWRVGGGVILCISFKTHHQGSLTSFCVQTPKKKKKNTYESSAKSAIWILALRARISIRWRPSSVWSPLVRRRRRTDRNDDEQEQQLT